MGKKHFMHLCRVFCLFFFLNLFCVMFFQKVIRFYWCFKITENFMRWNLFWVFLNLLVVVKFCIMVKFKYLFIISSESPFTISCRRKFHTCANWLPFLKFHWHHVSSARLDSFQGPLGLVRCPWCNGYRRSKWTRPHEFKFWTRLIAFHIALIHLGKVWIQLFSIQLWVNSRANWVLQPRWCN